MRTTGIISTSSATVSPSASEATPRTRSPVLLARLASHFRTHILGGPPRLREVGPSAGITALPSSRIASTQFPQQENTEWQSLSISGIEQLPTKYQSFFDFGYVAAGMKDAMKSIVLDYQVSMNELHSSHLVDKADRRRDMQAQYDRVMTSYQKAHKKGVNSAFDPSFQAFCRHVDQLYEMLQPYLLHHANSDPQKKESIDRLHDVIY